MEQASTWVGMDVHKERIAVAVVRGSADRAVEWEVVNEAGAVRRLGRRLKRESLAGVSCCYEAGPCGYAVQRALQETGVRCAVVAPSLIPVRTGDRIKTDRRDARKLAELWRAGMLTEVVPPGEAEEAVRDLCRWREAVGRDLLRSRHRLTKFLVRRGIRWQGGSRWTAVQRAWVRGLEWIHEADRVVINEMVLAIDQHEARLSTVDSVLVELASQPPWAERVGWLRCFYGIDTLTAVTVVAELHGVERFGRARHLMAYLGLVPSERSSGARVRRGGVTKTGNAHIRRVLVEAAWHYRQRPAVYRGLQKRREGQPAWVIALADRAHQRLWRRYWRLNRAGKTPQVAVTAVARELVGFIWAVLSAPHQLACTA